MTENGLREKVIKGLECLAAQKGRVHTCTPFDCPYTDLHTCFAEIAKDALALLEAQEPVEPRKVGSIGCWQWYCGACGMAVEESDNYCHECGQAVKWE